MEEIFKDIQGYEGLYQISNHGRVKSFKCKNEYLLTPGVDTSGYSYVILHNKGRFNKLIHQLVAIHFLNHIPCGHKLVVNHKDFNRLNNHIDNLEIITHRENCNKKHLPSSSKYLGVYLDKKTQKWKSQIRINGKPEHLGTFTNEYDAYLAYKNKLKEITK